MISYDLKQKEIKLSKLSTKEERLKLIFMWIKQSAINFKYFDYLLSVVEENNFNDNVKTNSCVEYALLDYNKKSFTITNNHIEEIHINWHREDVIGICTTDFKDVTLTDDEIDEVMYALVHYHDAEQGLHWETIKCQIQNVIDERNKENEE